MSRLIIPYGILVILFCLGSTLLLLSSPHHVDIEFLIANTASLIIFPLTTYSLRKAYTLGKKTNITILLLFSVVCILSYYINDLIFNSVDGISSIILFPFTILVLTLLFIVNILRRRKTISNS